MTNVIPAWLEGNDAHRDHIIAGLQNFQPSLVHQVRHLAARQTNKTHIRWDRVSGKSFFVLAVLKETLKSQCSIRTQD